MDDMERGMSGQVAVIPKGTVIKGNIEIKGQLEMYGTIQGDIVSNDRVHLCGNVEGNLTVNELETKDSFIEGQIKCEQGVAIRENTVVLGNIEAKSLEVDGAIQGNLDIKGNITVGAQAIIDSDIKAKTIKVTNGAALHGNCSLCYADIDLNQMFPETKKAKVVNGTEKLQAKEKNRRNVS